MRPRLPSSARSVAGLAGALAIAGAACGGRALDPSIFVWSATTGADDESTTSGEESTTGDPASPFCAGAVALRYDPAAGGIDAYPDDVLAEDADTPTGLRIRSLASALPEDDGLHGFPSLLEALATLDGFGTTGGAFLRFSGALDETTLPAPGDEIDPTTSALLLVDLDAPSPSFVAFDWWTERDSALDDSTALFVEPLRPLRPASRYGLVLTRRASDAAGDCIAPSPAMIDVLAGQSDDPNLARSHAPVAELVDVLREAGVVEAPHDLSAALVFTTQTTIAESHAIAAAIEAANPPPLTTVGCDEPFGLPWRTCEVTLTMADFTDATGVVVDAPYPQRFIDLPVTIWLPQDGTGPFPTIVHGHGLWGDRGNAWWLANLACPQGFAVVAIDAPKHGDHPDAYVVNEAIDLLGVSLDPDDPFRPLEARDNFRQAAFDKLQLLRRIEEGMDVDADGESDLDFGEVHYVGTSLGSVMGPQLLAFAPEIESAALVVGGARLTNIVANSPEFSALVDGITTGLDRAERARFLVLTQTAIEAGDPEVYAQHVLGDRLPGFAGGTPQILAQMAMGDSIVPNSSTGYLLRSLGMPVVGAMPFPIRDATHDAILPVSSNHARGISAGLFQFDKVLVEGSQTQYEPPTHYSVQSDPLALEQVLVFIETADNLAGATIIDPFAG